MKRWAPIVAVGMVLLYTALALGAAGCLSLPDLGMGHAHHAPPHAEHSPFCAWACQANPTASIHAATPLLGVFVLAVIQWSVRIIPHTLLLTRVSRARAPPR
jgi:hypothetical protein